MTRILVATWSDGIHVVGGGARRHELAGRSVAALAYGGGDVGSGGKRASHAGSTRDAGSTRGDGRNRTAHDDRPAALAIAAGSAVYRRGEDGAWNPIADTGLALSCLTAVGETLYAGTHDARLVRIDADGRVTPLSGFDAAEGRETWYAGTAVVDGEVVGPPLGVRSMTATADGRTLLANVHVGGIPRSTDGGATWRATIAVDADVHEVRAHPRRPNVVAAASAVGLCLSHDGGATWTIERDGLHAPYCSAVAFVGDDVLVAAAEHHFSAEGAIYRRALDTRASGAPLVRVRGGLPAWTGGIVDTHCIASRGSAVAAADARGNVYVSADGGDTWRREADGIAGPSALLLF